MLNVREKNCRATCTLYSLHIALLLVAMYDVIIFKRKNFEKWNRKKKKKKKCEEQPFNWIIKIDTRSPIVGAVVACQELNYKSSFNSFIFFPFNYSMKRKHFVSTLRTKWRKKKYLLRRSTRPRRTHRVAVATPSIYSTHHAILYANCKISIIQHTQHAVLACVCVRFMPKALTEHRTVVWCTGNDDKNTLCRKLYLLRE